MTHLIARLILAMLILPITGAVFVLLVVLLITPVGGPPGAPRLVAFWSVIYLFVGVYWTLLWHPMVRWTRQRVIRTALAAPASILVSGALASSTFMLVRGATLDLTMMAGGALVPICWVVATVLIWRETARERMERLTRTNPNVIVCPVCGYNLTGLHEARCPECGSRFTLDRLLAAQPVPEDVE